MRWDKLTWIAKEKICRSQFNRFYLKKLILKSLLYNIHFSDFHKMSWSLSFRNCPENSSQAAFRRACVLTHNPRSIFRMFKLSRHSLKRWVGGGYIQGLRKSSF